MYQVISQRLLIVIAILFALDASFSPVISVGAAKISFLTLLVLYVAFDWGWKKALPVAIIAGILKDFYGSVFLGMETFSLAFTVLTLDWALKKVEKKSWFIRLGIVFLFITIQQTLNYVLVIVSGEISVFAWHQVGAILITALYHMIVFLFFFKIAIVIFDEQRRVHQYELFN
jgi:rod shape-determining protein MreD